MVLYTVILRRKIHYFLCVCARSYMCAHEYVCACACEGQRSAQMPFIALYLILKTGFFTELKLTNSGSLGGQ